MYASPLPKSAHSALAAQSFMDSITSWKPELGSFRTHMFGSVMHKGKRLNLKYQNIGYIPEARSTKYQLFNNTVNVLKEIHGREPSTHEIADELKWSVKTVDTMQKEMRKDLVMDESKTFSVLPSAQSDKTMQAARDIMYSLNPPHQVVLEHLMGFNGKPVLLKSTGGADINAIAKATKITPTKIRGALKTITRRLKDYRDGAVTNTDMVEEE